MKSILLNVVSLPFKLSNLITSAIFSTIEFLWFYIVLALAATPVALQFVLRMILWPFNFLCGLFRKNDPAPEKAEVYTPTLEEEVTEWYRARKEHREPKFNVRPIAEIVADFLEEGCVRAAPTLSYGGSVCSPRPKGYQTTKVTILEESIDPTRFGADGKPVMVKNSWPARLRAIRKMIARGNRKPLDGKIS